MWTLCSIGSNQNPANNTARTLERLAQWFGSVHVSPLIETPPVDVLGDAPFLNGLVRFESSLSDAQLKHKLVDLEISLGRDRDHPDSKRRARPMDIDILDRALRRADLSVEESTPYLDLMLAADQGLGHQPRWEITVGGDLLGKEPTTVYFDDCTGQIGVIDQQPYRIQDRFKPAFASQ